MFSLLGLIAAALFTGAALYINVAEQPARLTLDEPNMLRQWKPAYARGYVMQSSLAILGGVCGAIACVVSGSLFAALGAGFMLANWPFTLVVIMPVNKKLKAIPEEAAAQSGARALIVKWAGLHAVRTVFGAIATGCFFVACLSAQ